MRIRWTWEIDRSFDHTESDTRLCYGLWRVNAMPQAIRPEETNRHTSKPSFRMRVEISAAKKHASKGMAQGFLVIPVLARIVDTRKGYSPATSEK